MDSVGAAIAAINDMKRESVVKEYALGDALAVIFWSEPTPTFDLDVFVLLEQTETLVSLKPIYNWAHGRGYEEKAEHIIIEGIPVQVVPAHNELAVEAISNAVPLDYDKQSVRVIRPEYLIAMFLEPPARTRKRLERVATLLDEGNLDHRLLDDLLARFKLVLPKTL